MITRRSIATYAVPGLLVVLTLLVRGSATALLYPQFKSDPDGYGELAVRLAGEGRFAYGDGRPTAFRPPLYPLLLTLAVHKHGLPPMRVAALHMIIGLFTVLGTYAVALGTCHSTGGTMGRGRRPWWDKAVAGVAALMVLVDPLLVYQSTLPMTETLAALLTICITASWFAYWHRPRPERAVLTGALLGLGALCRPAYLAWLICSAPCIGLHRDVPGRRRILHIGLMMGGAALFLLPWGARNHSVWGRWILTTTHGGYTLWLANNDEYYDFLLGKRSPDAEGGVWNSRQLDAQWLDVLRAHQGDEVAADRTASQRAWDVIRRRPAAAALAGWVRLGQFWNPLPHAVEGRWSHGWLRGAIAAMYLSTYALAALGLAGLVGRAERSAWVPVLTFVIALSLVHTLYWSNPRMRAPLAPILALLAARGLSFLGGDREQTP